MSKKKRVHLKNRLRHEHDWDAWRWVPATRTTPAHWVMFCHGKGLKHARVQYPWYSTEVFDVAPGDTIRLEHNITIY
ncbi:MAG TPA: hypothetical protein VLA89_06925 [Gemmatimonadales bacterium]|nr:hypothetical protein [Gemmatimonadales bacterium]